MAKVGVIVVSYRTDPQPLFNSIAASRHEVRWYIFVHGQGADVRSKLDAFAGSTNSRYFPYGVNRGLARSWNEGLRASFGDGNDVTIILNDDLFFYDGGFDQFVDFVLLEKQRVPNFGLIMLYGMEPKNLRHPGSEEKHFKQILTFGACFALGQGAIDKVGYFDENFWPAYFEDFDYHYRLGLAGTPILYDERTLLEHHRSSTVRNDRLIALLHGERLLRNERYYRQKWGGGLDEEMFVNPFNDETLSCFISGKQHAVPFCEAYNRTDLGSSNSIGFLEDNFGEEILGILHRHTDTVRRYLEWGTGKSTAIMTEYAKIKGADFFLSIDHVAERLRQTAENLPKYPFLHFRFVGFKDATESDPAVDIAYVAYPSLLALRFDVILIAGRCQMECALFAPAVLAQGGLVILYDEERARHRAMRQFLETGQIGPGPDSVAVLDDREQAHDRALRELYDVVEESRQFVVLRPRRRKSEP